MARFEGQEGSDDRLGGTLEAAARELRAALEREAGEVMSRAREEAASVEQDALRKAEEIESEARARAAQADASVRAAQRAQSDRIAELIHDVDALEERICEMVGDLRGRLTSAIEDTRTPLPEAGGEAEDRLPAAENGRIRGSGAEEAGEPQSPEREPERVSEREQPVAFSGPVPLSVATEMDAATQRSPMLDDMMRAQIVTLAQNGAPRADAERFLSRFKLGESYIGVVDEIYSQRGAVRAGVRREQAQALRATRQLRPKRAW